MRRTFIMASVFQARVARIHKFRPKCTSPIRTSRQCFGRKGPQWFKMRNSRAEHMSSGMAPIADMREPRRHFRDVPETDIETEPQLQHLIDVEAPAIAHTRTLSNRTNAIEPGVLFRTGFEVRRSAEIVAGGIDCVATVEAIDDLFGTVPK